MGIVRTIIEQPEEFPPLVQMAWAAHKAKRLPKEPNLAFCYDMLNRVSRRFLQHFTCTRLLDQWSRRDLDFSVVDLPSAVRVAAQLCNCHSAAAHRAARSGVHLLPRPASFGYGRGIDNPNCLLMQRYNPTRGQIKLTDVSSQYSAGLPMFTGTAYCM